MRQSTCRPPRTAGPWHCQGTGAAARDMGAAQGGELVRLCWRHATPTAALVLVLSIHWRGGESSPSARTTDHSTAQHTAPHDASTASQAHCTSSRTSCLSVRWNCSMWWETQISYHHQPCTGRIRWVAPRGTHLHVESWWHTKQGGKQVRAFLTLDEGGGGGGPCVSPPACMRQQRHTCAPAPCAAAR